MRFRIPELLRDTVIFADMAEHKNCGPYYAYNYEKESITSGDISASLNDIEKQGSGNSKDYTVTITYDGNKKQDFRPRKLYS